MTMRFGSLLLLVFLCSAEIIHIQSDTSTCECTEVGECLRCDENGCNQVSSCNGKRDIIYPNYFHAVSADGHIMPTFNDETYNEREFDSYTCKCTSHGYCERRTDKNGDWHTVKDCSGENQYVYCHPTFCRLVTDGKCYCVHGYCNKCSVGGCKLVRDCSGENEYQYIDHRGDHNVHEGMCSCKYEYGTPELPCMKCYTNGCKFVDNCEREESQKTAYGNVNRLLVPTPSGCQFCDNIGCKEVPCVPACNDDRLEFLVNERCYAGMICGVGDVYCKYLHSVKGGGMCDKFVTCKCDMVDDTFTRCYGYKQGTHHCMTLGKCSHVVGEIAEARELPYRATCDCPPNFGLCKQCDYRGRCKYVEKCGKGNTKEFVAIESKPDNM